MKKHILLCITVWCTIALVAGLIYLLMSSGIILDFAKWYVSLFDIIDESIRYIVIVIVTSSFMLAGIGLSMLLENSKDCSNK